MGLSIKGLVELQKSYATLSKTMAAGEARAVKRVGVTIRANQARAIAGLVSLPVTTIKNAIEVAHQPTTDDPSVTLQVRQKGIPLKQYRASQNRSGVSFQIMKGAGRSILKAAFIVASIGGNVFGRVGIGSKKYGSPHVGHAPIVKLWGPSVASQYEKDEIQKVGDQTWATRLPVELDRETDFALSQAGF